MSQTQKEINEKHNKDIQLFRDEMCSLMTAFQVLKKNYELLSQKVVELKSKETCREQGHIWTLCKTSESEVVSFACVRCRLTILHHLQNKSKKAWNKLMSLITK
jgi:hypothetical protein